MCPLDVVIAIMLIRQTDSWPGASCLVLRVTRRPDCGRTVRFSSLWSGPLLRVRLFALLSSFLTLPAHRRNLKLALASGSANYSVGFQMPKRKTSFNHTWSAAVRAAKTNSMPSVNKVNKK